MSLRIIHLKSLVAEKMFIRYKIDFVVTNLLLINLGYTYGIDYNKRQKGYFYLVTILVFHSIYGAEFKGVLLSEYVSIQNSIIQGIKMRNRISAMQAGDFSFEIKYFY